MNFETKLKRLETATRATETCLVCEAISYYDKVFNDELARLGVRRTVTEISEPRECFECGQARTFDLTGCDTEMRRQWTILHETISSKLRARNRNAYQQLNKMIDELNELSNSMEAQAAVHQGKDAPFIKQASDKADAVLRAWCEANTTELKQMMRRLPLVERRGFAA